jgi:shikimate kinase
VPGRRRGKAARRQGVRGIVLIGFMGAGKSSVGKALGQRLGWAFEDLDQRIEIREGRKVSDIFRDSGEAGFRRAEHAALQELLQELKPGEEKIIALGGGAFVQKENASLLEASAVPTVFLDGDAAELWRRCRQQAENTGTERPLLGSLESFRTLYEARRPHYLKAPFRQDTVGKTVEEIAKALVQALGLE